MHMWWSIAFNEGERILIMYLAHGTRARSAHESQNCAILSINCPFTENSAFWLCVNDIVVDLPRRKDATKVFVREVNTTKYIINAVLPSSHTCQADMSFA